MFKKLFLKISQKIKTLSLNLFSFVKKKLEPVFSKILSYSIINHYYAASKPRLKAFYELNKEYFYLAKEKATVFYKSIDPKVKKYLFILILLVALIKLSFLGYSLYKEYTTIVPGKVTHETVQLTEKQVQELNVGFAEEEEFQPVRSEVGYVDLNQNKAVQVFSPYQGKIGEVLVNIGDDVQEGDILYTVKVPDVAQAASNLISTAGVLRAADQTLNRAKLLYQSKSISQKEYEQNVSDQQAAEAAYRAARKSMVLFGIKDSDIDQIIKSRKIDIDMPVRSPTSGKVINRNAAPGLLVQPGNAPAPVVVGDANLLWLVANVPESEIGDFQVGQEVMAKVTAYPDIEFKGLLKNVGETSDPATHRIVLLAEINDPSHLLRPQMLASFQIKVGKPERSLGVPQKSLVRLNDGTFIVWERITESQFRRRPVKIGISQEGMVQILEGLDKTSKIAKTKALFLENLYEITSE